LPLRSVVLYIQKPSAKKVRGNRIIDEQNKILAEKAAKIEKKLRIANASVERTKEMKETKDIKN